jgi:hypothetical protein
LSITWERIRALEGQTLHTLKRNCPFRITEVMSDRVVFVPQNGKRTARWYPRKELEYIASLGIGRDELRARIQREWPNDQNTSYAAAIIYAATGSDPR